MPFTVNDIKYYYSGGAGNSNQANSLGGVISNTRVASQNTSVPVNVTGVTITSAVNNTQGVGILSWSPGTNSLGWQPPGSASIYSVSGVTASGEYTIGGGDGVLTLQVVVGSLSATYKQDSITVTNAIQNVFDSVGPLDSLLGSVEYRCIYVKNTNGSITASDARIWIKQLTTGPDEIHIGLDPAGIGNGTSTGVATTVANEDTPPAGVVFSQPLSYATGLVIGTLLAGQTFAVWQRRTVPANTVGDISANSSALAVAVTV